MPSPGAHVYWWDREAHHKRHITFYFGISTIVTRRDGTQWLPKQGALQQSLHQGTRRRFDEPEAQVDVLQCKRLVRSRWSLKASSRIAGRVTT